MTDLQTCAACGHTALDVRRTLVELEPPWRMVHDQTSGKGMPERFVTEPRCKSKDECAARQEVSA